VEGRPLTESELMERARSGDIAAYEELVRRYEQLAFRAAYLVCRDTDEARDAPGVRCLVSGAVPSRVPG
jgi:hypothetical protein